MAENEQKHRHFQEDEVLKLEAKSQRDEFALRSLGTGMWFGLMTVGLAVALTVQETGGISIIGGTGAVWAIVTLVRLLKGNGHSSNGNS